MAIDASAPPPAPLLAVFILFFSCATIALSLPEKAHTTLCQPTKQQP
jgi:hypothetical protein